MKHRGYSYVIYQSLYYFPMMHIDLHVRSPFFLIVTRRWGIIKPHLSGKETKAQEDKPLAQGHVMENSSPGSFASKHQSISHTHTHAYSRATYTTATITSIGCRIIEHLLHVYLILKPHHSPVRKAPEFLAIVKVKEMRP